MKRVLCSVVLLLLFPMASAFANEGYGFWRREKDAVGAVAYQAPTSSKAAAPSHNPVAPSLPIRTALVPLAAQALCGHDPRWPGGLSCPLPPPPKPRVADRPKRPQRQTPEEVARLLTDRAIRIAPEPELRFAPRRRGLTGLESYFWLAERPRRIQAQASVGGFVVTAQARPAQYVWTFGDGTDLVSRRSGRKWTRRRPGNIGHTYEWSERYRVRVEVIWEARWRIGAGPWRHLGYFSNTDGRRYRVREIVPVLVPAN